MRSSVIRCLTTLVITLAFASPALGRQLTLSSYLSSEIAVNSQLDLGEGVGMTFC